MSGKPKFTLSEPGYLLMVCIMVGLFLALLVRQDRERNESILQQYLPVSLGEPAVADYTSDPLGTPLPQVQVKIISEVIGDEENSEIEAQERFATVENNLLTPVPLISNRFASATPTQTPTQTRIPPPTPTPTLTPTHTSTPDPCTHGHAEGNTWVVGLCDNFWYISWQTGYSYEDLIAINPDVSVYDLILPGQLLHLPETTPGPTATPATPTMTPTPTQTVNVWTIFLPFVVYGE